MRPVAAALLWLLAAGCASRRLPARVTIRSLQCSWGSDQAELVIRRTKDGYTDGTRRLDPRLLRRLVARASAPPLPTLDVTRLGVASASLVERRRRVAALPPHTQARMLALIGDPKNLATIANLYYREAWHTDDQATVTVDIVMPGQRRITVSSRVQNLLMLPWHVARDGHTSSSYDPDLSRAIAALLPAHFVNEERIAGRRLVDELAHFAPFPFHEELSQLQYDEQTTPLRTALAPRFRIERLDLDDEPFNGGKETSWLVRLGALDDRQLHFALVLTEGRDMRIASVAPFLRDVDALVGRVRALPWVTDYLAQHPQATVTIDYRDDRSLGKDAQATVVDRLQREGHADIARAMAPELDRSIGVLLRNGNSFARWIVLPDGRSVLYFASAREAEGRPTATPGDVVPP